MLKQFELTKFTRSSINREKGGGLKNLDEAHLYAKFSVYQIILTT